MKTLGTTILLLLSVLFVTVHTASAFDFGRLVGGAAGMIGNQRSAAFDLDATVTQFHESLWGATKLTAEAVQELYIAIGKKEEAVQMQVLLEKLAEAKENDDQEALKEISDQINNAVTELKTVELESEVKVQEAQKHVGIAFLKTGVAVFLDKKAVESGEQLAEKVPDEIQANPFQAVKLFPILKMAKYTLTSVPHQLGNLGYMVSNLSRYSSTHGMEAPSKSEKTKTAAAYAPSVASDEVALAEL